MELIVIGVDLDCVCDVVDDGVGEGERSWLLVVVMGRGGHVDSSFRERVLILLD